jgi:hypothetical protein
MDTNKTAEVEHPCRNTVPNVGGFAASLSSERIVRPEEVITLQPRYLFGAPDSR